MQEWIFWLILIIFLTIVEVSTVSLVSIWFIASGIISLILSLFIDNFILQFSVFVVLGVILLITTRPILNKLMYDKNVKTNLDMVIGKSAIVTKEIKKNQVGEVKALGKYWSAISNTKLVVDEEVTLTKDEVKLSYENFGYKCEFNTN